MLLGAYPDHKWYPWKFHQVSKNFWDRMDRSQEMEFVEWLSKELEIRVLDDWYRISFEQVRKVAPTTLFAKFGLPVVLGRVYPNHTWCWTWHTSPNRLYKCGQGKLRRVVEKLFPNKGISRFGWH